jgi:hypothetical protein
MTLSLSARVAESNRTSPLSAQVWEGESLCVMARMKNVTSDSYLTEVQVSSIVCAVYDGDTLVTSPAVVVADAISDTLVADDGRWTKDRVGYNFVFVLAGLTCFPDPDTVYRVEFVFTTSSGHRTALVVSVRTEGLRSV